MPLLLRVAQDIYAFFNWANISKHPTTTIVIGALALIELIASIVILCRRQHNVKVRVCSKPRASSSSCTPRLRFTQPCDAFLLPSRLVMSTCAQLRHAMRQRLLTSIDEARAAEDAVRAAEQKKLANADQAVQLKKVHCPRPAHPSNEY